MSAGLSAVEELPVGSDRTDVVASEPTVPVAGRSPGSPSRPGHPRPTTTQRLGAVISVVGVLLCGFVAYELVLTDVVARRSQDLLRPRLAERFGVERSLATTDATLGAEDSRAAFGAAAGTEEEAGNEGAPTTGDDAASEEAITRRIEQPPLGEPVALLSIPRIGLEQVVVEGSGQTQLNSGPGHYRGSPLPGRVGNVVIAGRRATYGAPFERLGQLREGDRILVATGRGSFDYRVDEVGIVDVGEPDVVGEDGTNKLTLVTADSPFDATGRLVVTARLGGSATTPAAETVEQSAARLALPESELGLQRDATAWAPTLIWGQALVGLWFARRWLRSRWTPASRWIVGAPLTLTVVVLFFESVSRLLPATL